MMVDLRPVRLFLSKAPVDRLVWITPSAVWGQKDSFSLQIAKGSKRKSLAVSQVYGPFSESELTVRLQEIIQEFIHQGYRPSGFTEAVDDLKSGIVANRASAARRLPRKTRLFSHLLGGEACEALMSALAFGGEDKAVIMDALGSLGDSRAFLPLRLEADRKLLSRRRSAVEALRRLGDSEGLSKARSLAFERLPESIRLLFSELPEGDYDQANKNKDLEKIIAIFEKVDPKDKGYTVDSLYELATPIGISFTRWWLSNSNYCEVHTWRYVKSVLKRAMLRNDYETFGLIVYKIEVQGREKNGIWATVKSGWDGKDRYVRIFGKFTRNYLRRRAWRYLCQIANESPYDYAFAAAESIVHYQPSDSGNLNANFEDCYLLHRVLWGAGNRFQFERKRMKFVLNRKVSSKVIATVREESFSELWDAQPEAYLRLLAFSKLKNVQEFACTAVETRHKDVLSKAQAQHVVGMLSSVHEPTVKLALAELRRRFDPNNPDWLLLEGLLASAKAFVKSLGLDWLAPTAHLWCTDTERTVKFLLSSDEEIRGRVVSAMELGLPKVSDEQRVNLANKFVGLLRGKEPSENAYDGIARVAMEALAEEVSSIVSLTELLNWLAEGSNAAKAVAAQLFSRKPSSFSDLGSTKITAMGWSDIVFVREAARTIVRSHLDEIRKEPSILFSFVESEWEDIRQFAITLLRESVNLVALGLDGIVALCDSNRLDVQNLGKDLVKKHFDALDPGELISRLTQHHHPNVRSFALELVTDYLQEDTHSLAKVERFFRTVLLEIKPQKMVKQRLISFLSSRGQKDELQAEIAIRLLGEFARTQGKQDFEQVIEALVRIRLAFPNVASPVQIPDVSLHVSGGLA